MSYYRTYGRDRSNFQMCEHMNLNIAASLFPAHRNDHRYLLELFQLSFKAWNSLAEMDNSKQFTFPMA